MKAIKYSFLVLLSVFIYSCEDFLDVDTSKAGLPMAVAYQDPVVVRGILDGIYTTDNMGKSDAYNNRADLYYMANTDVERNKSVGVSTTWDSKDGAGLANYLISSNSNNAGLETVWKAAYNCIELCNTALKGIRAAQELKSESELPQYKAFYAEALAMRAYFYYDLITWWGDVPARFMPIADEYILTRQINKQASPREEIYDRILLDLDSAASMIGSYNKTNIALPTMPAIRAIRARVALSAAGYALRPNSQVSLYEMRPGSSQNAYAFVGRVGAVKRSHYYTIVKDECAYLINNNHVNVNMQYENVFKAISKGEVNSANTEALWQLKYRSNFVYGWGLSHAANGPYTVNSKGTGSRGYAVTPLFFDYDSTDTRRNVTVPVIKWATPIAAFPTSWLQPTKMNNLWFGKFRPEWSGVGSDMIPDNGGSTYGASKLVIRMSDVYLMHAEACLELNLVAEGQPSLDAVVKRAYGSNIAPTIPLTLDNIIEQRKLEFAGEPFIRRRDLTRWGKLKEAMDIAAKKCQDLQASINGNPSINGYNYSDVPNKVYYKISSTDNTKILYYGLNRGQSSDITQVDPAWKTASVWGAALIAGSASAGGTDYDKLFYSSLVDPDLSSLFPFTSTMVSSSQGTISNMYGY